MRTVFNQQKSGFALIEVLVSLALFTTVMLISVSALLALIDANRKAQSLQSVNNNLNFAFDNLTRNIATGGRYYCSHEALKEHQHQDLPNESQDCPEEQGSQSGAQPEMALTNYKGERVGYRLNDSRIERRVDSSDTNGNWIPITAEEIIITNLSFFVTGAPKRRR